MAPGPMVSPKDNWAAITEADNVVAVADLSGLGVRFEVKLKVRVDRAQSCIACKNSICEKRT